MSKQIADLDSGPSREDITRAIKEANGAAEAALRVLYRRQFGEEPEVSD